MRERFEVARDAFTTGADRQSLPERQRITEATETVRTSRHMADNGLVYDALKVYTAVSPDEVPEALYAAIADEFGLEEVDRVEYKPDRVEITYINRAD